MMTPKTTKSKGKVLLAFSGGIDSQYAANKLIEEGYEVDALILDMFNDSSFLNSAGESAQKMGINFRVADVTEPFERKIIDYFVLQYVGGRTPAPCTMCNFEIKWHTLHQIAVSENYDHIATGHYFNVVSREGVYYVSKAKDTAKDQSYYLWMLPQAILKMALTPMGNVIKADIMKNLNNHTRPKESMGVCFLRGLDYRDFIKGRCNKPIKGGDIVNLQGEVLGGHRGLALYTIGQKRGIEAGADLSVIGMDSANNQLIVGNDSELYHKTLVLENWRINNPEELFNSAEVSVMIRGFGRNPEGYCKIEQSNGELVIKLDNPAWAAAPGQPIVLYIGQRVVGGGFLNRSH